MIYDLFLFKLLFHSFFSRNVVGKKKIAIFQSIFPSSGLNNYFLQAMKEDSPKGSGKGGAIAGVKKPKAVKKTKKKKDPNEPQK
jgi:hypothetical protein